MNYEPHDRIPMQLLTFTGVQDPTFKHRDLFGGAYINCWIKDQTSKNAVYIAEGCIQKSGWIVQKLEDHSIVNAEDYIDDEDGKQYFEQAMIDEEVFVFHSFPKDKKSEPAP